MSSVSCARVMSIATEGAAEGRKPNHSRVRRSRVRTNKEHNRGVELAMKKTIAFAAAAAISLSALLVAQEEKKVPKDSVRVAIPGCAKGYVFTVARRTSDEPGSADIPEGMRLRMNGSKKLMNEIKGHEGQLIQLTGLMKKGQFAPGVGI